MPKGKIGDQPYEVPEGWTIISVQERDRCQRALEILSDLDRSPAGRHEGDVESGALGERSQGNPHLTTGQTIGYMLYGNRRIVVPEPRERGNPEAWIAHKDGDDG